MIFKWYDKYYDHFINLICPDYMKSLDILVNAIPTNTKQLKELGCGTGNLTIQLAKKLPRIKIIGYDINKNQLRKARKKLAKYKNVQLMEQDISKLNFNKGDVIVSSLLFHLLPKPMREKTLKKIITAEVKAVYFFDRLKGESYQQEKEYKKYFRQNLAMHNLPAELLEELICENQVNNPDKLSEQAQIFSSKGYSLSMIYQNPAHGFTVYCFRK